FAGSTSVSSETCTGTCYNDCVIGAGSNYGNAYFEIASVTAYRATGTKMVNSGSGAI
ncbi:hypothetical protein C8J56DRAFT_751222, partial [Mycena floridula]